MISCETRYVVRGADQVATPARSLRALDPIVILGAGVCPQHDRLAATAVTPNAALRLRGVSGTTPSMKINKFDSQPVPGSIPWSSPV